MGLAISQDDMRVAQRIVEHAHGVTEVAREVARYRAKLEHDHNLLVLLRNSPFLPQVMAMLHDRFAFIRQTPTGESLTQHEDKLRFYERLIVLLGSKVRGRGRPPNYLKGDLAS